MKCASCNIVISEILAYLQNKVDTMDNESMVRICASAFTISEVEKAKCLLFDSIKTNKRNISRRKDGKIQRALEDIIAIFKETDPEVMPIFVARELNKLPPITFDHVDVTALLKDIVRLKSDIHEIKNTYVTTKQIEDLENKLFNCQHSTDYQINLKRGGYAVESEQMAIQTRDRSMTEREVPTCQSQNNLLHSLKGGNDASYSIDMRAAPRVPINYSGRASGSPSPCLEPTELTVQMNAPLPTMSPCAASATNGASTADSCKQSAQLDNIAVRKLSFAEIVGNNEGGKQSKEDDKWLESQKKRLRNMFIGNTGKADSNCTKFKAAETKIPLFVSNVHKDVIESDIVNYIYDKTKEKVSLLKIKMKKQRDYNAYKMYVAKHNIDIFLDDKLWPSGITFRRFVNIRDNTIVKGEIKQRVPI